MTVKSELVSIRDGNISEENDEAKSELVDRFGATQQVSYLNPQLLENNNGALDAVTQNTIEVNKRDSMCNIKPEKSIVPVDILSQTNV